MGGFFWRTNERRSGSCKSPARDVTANRFWIGLERHTSSRGLAVASGLKVEGTGFTTRAEKRRAEVNKELYTLASIAGMRCVLSTSCCMAA